MDGVRKNIINTIVLGGILIFMAAAYLCKSQEISYDLANAPNTVVTLSPGETLVQPYFPNRKNIKEFTFVLDGQQTLHGEYSLIVAYGNDSNDSNLFNITNVYNGEEVDELCFRLPQIFTPNADSGINLSLISESNNTNILRLSADESFKSYYYSCDNYSEKIIGDATLFVKIISEKNQKWFTLWCMLLYTIGVSLLIMHFLNTDFEDTIALAIIGIVIITYILGFMNLLTVANPGLYIISAVGIIMFFYDCAKNQQLFWNRIKFQYFLWIFTVVVLFLCVHHTYIGDPDSAFYISKCKYMFWSDSLAFDEGYAFFLPIFAYLFESANGLFTEDIYLISIKVYEFSLLFSFLGCMRLKNKRLNYLTQIFLLAICAAMALAIKPEAYFTAVMDIPFAITIAYILKNFYENKEKSFLIVTISAIAACLIKRAGFPLVIICAMLIAMHSIKHTENPKTDKYNCIKQITILILSCILALIAVAVFTRNAAPIINEKTYSSFDVDCLDGNEVEDAELQEINTGFQDAVVVIKNLINAFFYYRVCFGGSYAEIIGLMFAFAALIWLIKGDDESFSFLKTTLELMIAAILYYGVIAYKYLFAIEEINRIELNAYDRYAIHFIGGAVIFELILGTKTIINSNKDKQELRVFVSVIIAMILVLTQTKFENVKIWVNDDIIAIEDGDEALTKMLTLYSGASICMYCPGQTFDESGYYGKNMTMNAWPNSMGVVTQSIETITLKESLIEYLYDNYEYLYLLNYDTCFMENCAGLFENGEKGITRHSIYYIKKDAEGNIFLKFMGQVPLNDMIFNTPDGSSRVLK